MAVHFSCVAGAKTGCIQVHVDSPLLIPSKLVEIRADPAGREWSMVDWIPGLVLRGWRSGKEQDIKKKKEGSICSKSIG